VHPGVADQYSRLGVCGFSSTLVTYTQLGHSYAIRPGSRRVGSTSSIVALQRGHDMLDFVFERSCTAQPLGVSWPLC
jgi:hypothetical protein